MTATKKQKQLIHVNSPNRDMKEEYVQWVTGDTSKTSCNDLNFDQANSILKELGVKPQVSAKEDTPLFWGYYDPKNKQQAQIRSLLHQIKWTVPNKKYGRVPDLERFGNWLQGNSPRGRSPVKKPLKKMSPTELTTTINALNGILKDMYK